MTHFPCRMYCIHFYSFGLHSELGIEPYLRHYFLRKLCFRFTPTRTSSFCCPGNQFRLFLICSKISADSHEVEPLIWHGYRFVPTSAALVAGLNPFAQRRFHFGNLLGVLIRNVPFFVGAGRIRGAESFKIPFLPPSEACKGTIFCENYLRFAQRWRHGALYCSVPLW